MSWSEQGGGDDADAVGATVRVASGGDHDGVEQAIADLVAQPGEVTYVVVAHGVRQFHFEGDDAMVIALDDQVDLVFAAVGAQVSALTL